MVDKTRQVERYAEMGFSIPEQDIEALSARIMQTHDLIEAIRDIDVTGVEPATIFAPSREVSSSSSPS